MRSTGRWTLAGGFALLLGAAVVGHVRLETSGGNPFFWSNEQNVQVIINATGSDDIADESETAAVRLAIEEWNAVAGTTVQLVEDTSPGSRMRTDWQNGASIVLFDEDDSSGYFPGSSGTVAVTPILFNGNGSIDDADILFNGDDWQFTTTGEPGKFDVQDVVTHEMGHLLGLDHSGWAGSTMYPYVDPAIILHRSVSEDEVHGLRDAYPAQSFGRISGTVERVLDDSPIEGAHVVARSSAGRTVSGALTNQNGNFTLRGLAPDTYTVYAVPLDGPVSSQNLGDGTSFTVQTDFEPALYGSTATITGTENVNLGILTVEGDQAINLGQPSDLLPVRATVGEVTGPVFLSGTGLVNGSTITASDPDVTISGEIFFTGSVSFFVTVPPGEALGHVDLTVAGPGGELTILPSALEISDEEPTVSAISPAEGNASGGALVTITGDDFLPGSRIVIGDQVYTDGIDASVAGDDTITLTTKPTFAGMHDVVVYAPSGVEGRLLAGFRTGLIPTVQVLFPTAGDIAGGTQVTVTGADFTAGLEVRIDGDVQTVDSVTPTQIVFTTVSSTATVGVPQAVEIENPDGEIATSSFTFQGQADPVLSLIDPPQGKTSGGELVTLSGTGFTNDTAVFFGADPLTGGSGVSAAMVTFVSSTMLTIVTPSQGKGATSVMVQDMSSGQSAILPDGFTFKGSGGGGGGCYMRQVDGASGPGALAGAWWMLALLVLLAAQGRRAASRTQLLAEPVRRS